MALQTQDLMMRLQPLSPIKLDLGDMQNASMERQRLALLRAQFEETKKKNAQDEEYRQMHEAAEMTRAQMQVDRERAQQEALAKAELLKQQREAQESMLKRPDTGDYEGMELDATRINELGGLAERTGQDENGFPTWHVEADAEKYRQQQAAQDAQAAPGEVDNPENPYSSHPGDESLQSSLSRMGALGYGKLNARGTMDETTAGAAEPLSTEDAFRQAQGAARGPDEEPAQPEQPQPGVPYSEQYLAEQDAAQNYAEPGRSTPMLSMPQGLEPSIFQATGRPARGPDQPDMMGGVPKNTIDTGAMTAQRNMRLGPVMADIEKGMPEAYRQETAANNDAAMRLGLPADKTMTQSLALRAPANAAIKGELDAERDAEKAKVAAEPKALTRKDILTLQKGGAARADKMYKNLGIDEVPSRTKAAQAMVDLLEDDDPNNDQAIAFELPNMLGSKGAQSNKDLAVALGIDAMSTTDQIQEYISHVINGGYTEMRKESLIGVIKKKMENDNESVFQFLDAMDEASKGTMDPEIRAGLDGYLTNVPKEYREAWARDRASAAPAGDAEEGDEAATPAGGGDFKETLHAEASDAGLDSSAMLRVMGGESNGGDPKAANDHSSARGIIQMTDETARGYVNPHTGEHFKDADELTQLTAAEQAPIAVQYFADKFDTAGVTQPTPEDYALAVAAPAFVGKSRDDSAVVYPKDSKEWKANKPWRPADGGDITVGSLIDYYFGKTKAAAPKTEKPKASAGKDDAKLLEGL